MICIYDKIIAKVVMTRSVYHVLFLTKHVCHNLSPR